MRNENAVLNRRRAGTMEIVQSRLGVHTNLAREDPDVVSIPYLKIADNGTKVGLSRKPS
jgi:hypothetical protein